MVSLPVLRTLTLILPDRLKVAPMTSSPTCLLTGRLSPVIIDSSTEVSPSIITPSVGIFPPGLTIRISSTFTYSIATSCSVPFFTIVAVAGCISSSFLIVSAAFPLAKVSKYLPRSISDRTSTLQSKYSFGVSCVKQAIVL
ncbi:hypothetical protein D3C73_671730 [compost metagenome]